MKTLIFTIVYLAVNAASGQDVIGRYAEAMSVPRQDVASCLNRARMTLEGLIRMHNTPEDELSKTEESVELSARTGCFLACMYQLQGMMDGSTILIDDIHKLIDSRHDGDQPMNSLLHASANTCYEKAKGATEECSAALELTLCVSLFVRNAP